MFLISIYITCYDIFYDLVTPSHLYDIPSIYWPYSHKLTKLGIYNFRGCELCLFVHRGKYLKTEDKHDKLGNVKHIFHQDKLVNHILYQDKLAMNIRHDINQSTELFLKSGIYITVVNNLPAYPNRECGICLYSYWWYVFTIWGQTLVLYCPLFIVLPLAMCPFSDSVNPLC